MKKLIILLLIGFANAETAIESIINIKNDISPSNKVLNAIKAESWTLEVITNNDDLTQELIDAKARGVKVKIIVDNFNIEQLSNLSKNGIETKSYKGSIDSFTIVNGKCVIQNGLSVCDPILVKNYQNQFNDYWNKSSNFVVVKNVK